MTLTHELEKKNESNGWSSCGMTRFRAVGIKEESRCLSANINWQKRRTKVRGVSVWVFPLNPQRVRLLVRRPHQGGDEREWPAGEEEGSLLDELWRVVFAAVFSSADSYIGHLLERDGWRPATYLGE
ncbi:hypothetical protein Cni_G07726 [Canna indica]|uniref:Uncharacterized protein n=1 Tax=Canna indica TaxID=4628 RepID=A0AAQ3K0V6_9LILI|nr:hypothetical protein Cni_G07726 [Canna indica]